MLTFPFGFSSRMLWSSEFPKKTLPGIVLTRPLRVSRYRLSLQPSGVPHAFRTAISVSHFPAFLQLVSAVPGFLLYGSTNGHVLAPFGFTFRPLLPLVTSHLACPH